MILRAYRIVIGAIVTIPLVQPHPLYAADTPVPVKVTIDPTVVVATIPTDFVGLGYETCAVAQPDYFSAKNARLIKLYANLSPHGMVRIGGNISDHTRYVAGGTPTVKTEREVTIINRANLKDLGDFARATGWSVMWGLNLGTGSTDQAVEEALAVDAELGASLHSFEIGNEVDLMRNYSKNYDAYQADYTAYKTAIRAKLPRAPFSGPDSASSLPFVEKFVAAEAADMKLATHHYYRTGARTPQATLDYLLARDEAFIKKLQRLRELCEPRHVGYRINEVNSFYGGGKAGVSDTFGSALWCLDYCFTLAEHGCAGVNIETDINQLGFISHYSPIVHDQAGVCSARPEYYGMLAFATAGRGRLLKTSMPQKPGVNLTAYATRADDGTRYLTLINKDLSTDATVESPLPTGVTVVDAQRLHAPALDAKTGVTFAGAAVADDGSWTPNPPQLVPFANNAIRLDVPHASACVVRFKMK